MITAIVCGLSFTVTADTERYSNSFKSGLPNGISSGDTSSDSTVLWARSSSPGFVEFEVRKAGGRSVYKTEVEVLDPAVPAKITVTDLQAGTRYRYRVTGVNGDKINGTFKTAADGNRRDKGLTFGVTGDWRGELAPYPAIKNADTSRLDFLVKLGDTIYADFPSPAVPFQAESIDNFRTKHQEVYSRHLGINSFADLQRKVSIFATIDDHEVIDDFSGGAPAISDPRFPEQTGLINQSQLFTNGLQAFTEYNAINSHFYPVTGDQRTDGKPDLYRSQQYGKVASLFMLDARSFRDAGLPGVTSLTDAVQIGTFIASSFDAFQTQTRTMLGHSQVQRLKQDLLNAQDSGVTWKFIAVPEPIQNLGVFAASDRFEGYASERSEILRFIDENAIKNVVFIAADIHGTIINDLTYQRREDVLQALVTTQNPLAAPQIRTSAFEISTGSVAFSPAFGDAVNGLLAQVPGGSQILQQMFSALGVSNLAEFNSLPMDTKNASMEAMLNQQLLALNYTPIGLKDNPKIDAKLIKGSNTALYSFGWTRFDIKPRTHKLKITTYGIEPYTAEQLSTNSAEILARKPAIVSQLIVTPNKD